MEGAVDGARGGCGKRGGSGAAGAAECDLGTRGEFDLGGAAERGGAGVAGGGCGGGVQGASHAGAYAGTYCVVSGAGWGGDCGGCRQFERLFDGGVHAGAGAAADFFAGPGVESGVDPEVVGLAAEGGVRGAWAGVAGY